MSKSARKTLTAPLTITVEDVHQISANLVVLSYLDKDSVRYEDIFNVDPSLVVTLLRARSGYVVTAELAPDSSADQDSHPEITSASSPVVPENEESK